MSYNIDFSFVFSLFVNTAYTLTNNAANNIIVNPQSHNLALKFVGPIPKIVDTLTK